MRLSVRQGEARPSIRTRATMITAGFLALLALTLVGMWLLLQGRYLRAEQQRNAHATTDILADVSAQPLEEGNILRLAYMADRTVLGETITRVMIADRTGQVIVDSAHQAYGTSPAIIRRALMRGNSVVESYPEYWQGATPVTNDLGQTLGCVTARFPTATFLQAQRNARYVGLLIALLGVLVGSALAFFAARIITGPLERLLEGIRGVQAGEVTEPLPVSGGAELAEIGNAFNEMSGAVRERVRRLEALNTMAADLPLALDMEDIVDVIRRGAADIMDAKSYLWVVDPLSHELSSVPGTGEEPVEGVVTADYAVGSAFARRHPISVGNGTADLPSGSEVAPGLLVHSGIAMPLETSDGTAGALLLADPGRRRWISDEDRAMAAAIRNLVAPVIMSRLRMEARTRAAGALQALLVPAEVPETGTDLAAVYVPAEEIAGLGGDYYDIFPVGQSRWAIIVGDTSGKGLDAARYTATAKYVVRSYILEYGDPAEALYWSNRALAIQEQAGRFITLFCGILDVNRQSLTYANAGHLPPLIYSRETGKAEYCSGQGIALGVTDDASYEEYGMDLHAGDVLCLYTDGITEARHDGEWFGDSLFPSTLEENAHLTSGEICGHIMGAVRDFTRDNLRDDVVLLVLKIP